MHRDPVLTKAISVGNGKTAGTISLQGQAALREVPMRERTAWRSWIADILGTDIKDCRVGQGATKKPKNLGRGAGEELDAS